MTGRVAAALLILSLAALAAAAAPPLQGQAFDCRGMVRTEQVFEAGTAGERERHWRIIVNDDAGYVKRDPEIAAGCVERTVEVCGCELGADRILCRSLGITRAGEEVGMDFSIDRRSGEMQLTGRRHDPKSGNLTETQGRLACNVTEAQ